MPEETDSSHSEGTNNCSASSRASRTEIKQVLAPRSTPAKNRPVETRVADARLPPRLCGCGGIAMLS